MKTILISLSLLTGICLSSYSQEYNLTLEESIEIAKTRSYEMQRLEQNLKIAEYNLTATTSTLRTQINLNMNLPRYTETVKQWEDSQGISFYSVKQLGFDGGLEISQPLPTDGRIYIQGDLSSVNDYYTDLRAATMRTRIGFSQPLNAFYGYNAIRTSLKQARLAYEQANKSYKRQELELIYNVSSSFYSLLSLQKSTEIALLDLERQMEAYEISRNKYDAGLIREVDALQMEVDLAEAQNNYDIALLNQNSTAASFKNILGLDLNDKVSLNNELTYEIVIVDPEKAVRMAMEHRLELREQDIQIELQDLAIKRQRNEGMIKSSITGHFEKFGLSNESNDLRFFKFMDHSFQDFKNRPSNYSIGLTISVPLLDWGGNRARVKMAKAYQIQNKIYKIELERNIETEVRNMVADLNSSLKRLQLLERNVVVAEKSFEITLQRFTDGDIDSQSLALERSRLNNAYTSRLSAYINYQLSLADLMRKTFYDFQRDELIE